mgnify:CR=1 FL=1
MDETSTTPGNDPTNGDTSTDSSTTSTDSTSTGTDNQTADNGNNLEPSKSTDTTSADGDQKPTGDSESNDDSASLNIDEDLDDWAERRGFPKAETDEQRQAYQKTRNDQREFTKSRQAEKDAALPEDLNKEIQDNKPESEDDDDEFEDDTEKRLKKLESEREQERVTRLQSEFYTTNNVTESEGKAILDIFKEKVSTPTSPEAKQRAFDYWSSPDALPDLLDLAKARLASSQDTSVIEDEAAKAERERIAKESNANSPGRGAKNPVPGTKTEEQKRLERFSNWD